MKASALITHLEGLDVHIFVRTTDGRMKVRNAKKLPPWLLQTVAAHREAIKRYLVESEDSDLKPVVARTELRRLGFMQIKELGGQFVHPQGDEVGDLILFGLIDPDEIARQEDAKREILHAMGRTGRVFTA